jgi:hypothetical protein
MPSIASDGPARDRAGFVARLTSLDEPALSLAFRIAPSEHERSFGANWDDAGVAQASPQFIEYRDSLPEERTYKCTFDAYRLPGGVANDIEQDYETLLKFTRRAGDKLRAHRLAFSQGNHQFRCVLTRVGMPVRRISKSGGALQALECSITLKETR